MIVDRRKDSYDELLVLARDSHISRTRTNRWTTGLIASAVAASALYVGTINSEMDEIATEKRQAEARAAELNLRLEIAERDRDLYRAQRDIYLQSAGWFAEQASMSILGDDIVSLGSQFTLIAGQPVEPGTSVRVVNNVMIVDGSRRFPMTDGDILWVPEGNLWVRLEPAAASDPDDPRAPGRKQRKVTLHYNSLPSGPDATGRPEFLGGAYRYWQESGKWSPGTKGNADCLELTLHYQSNRPAFAGNPAYVDLEVLLYNSEGSCPQTGRVVVIPENP